jgi:hypothetical protein
MISLGTEEKGNKTGALSTEIEQSLRDKAKITNILCEQPASITTASPSPLKGPNEFKENSPVIGDAPNVPPTREDVGEFKGHWILAQSFDMLAEIASNAVPLPVNSPQSKSPLQHIQPAPDVGKLPIAFLPSSSSSKRKQFYSFQEYHQDYIQKSTSMKIKQNLSLRERRKLDEFSKMINKRLFEYKQRGTIKKSPKVPDVGPSVYDKPPIPDDHKSAELAKPVPVNVVIDKDELLKQIKEQLKKKTTPLAPSESIKNE